MKKVLSALIVAVMLIGMLPMVAIPASAAIKKITVDEAIAWLRAQDYAQYDLDNSYGPQCSDFASAYMNWLYDRDPRSGAYGVYNANYYPTAASWREDLWYIIPNTAEFVPQPGDIFVSKGILPQYGHIGVVISSTVSNATIIDQNGVNASDYGSPARVHNISWNGAYAPTYFIRFKHFSDGNNSNPCTITYNANGGSLGSVPSSQTYNYATIGTTNLSSYKPTRSGYTFLGWSLSKNATSPSYYTGQPWLLANSGNYELYAVWKGETCTIKYNANGGSLDSVPSSQTYSYATTGTTNLSSSKPTRSGYAFLGWSLSKNATSPSYYAGHSWLLANSGNYELYAVWTPCSHKYSNTSDTSCNLCGAIRSITHPFKDVKLDQYYTEPVFWAVDKGITNGTSATTFSPDAACTRGQIVTFLWRTAGSPEPKSSRNPFVDVAYGQYYYKAVLWAVENGITTGTSVTTFEPEATCTRGQIVTFLYRAKGKPSAGASNPFYDVSGSAYYYNPVLWAVSKKITTGTSANSFEPDAPCTRAQIVTFLYRAYK